MALFGDDEGDVGPFVMAEDGEDWFPFTLDNLEMDRGCTPLQQDTTRPMEQDEADFGDTDEDDAGDGGSPAGASGPGPPSVPGTKDGPRKGISSRTRPRSLRSSGSSSGGDGVGRKAKQAHAARSLPILPAKTELDKVKPEAKEVHEAKTQQKRLVLEATETKRGARGARSDAKNRHRAAGGMAGGVGGMRSRAESAAASSNKDRSDVRVGAKVLSATGPGNGTSGSGGGEGGGGGGGGGGMGGGGGGVTTKTTSVQNRRRLERNAREQKRSLKISQRIEDLRAILTQFGVDVKASKSAVLSEATDYIAHLQRQQAQFEAERARLLQLLHNANSAGSAGSTLTPTATAAVAPASISSSAGSGGDGDPTLLPGAVAIDPPDASIAASGSIAATPSNATMMKPSPTGSQQRTLPFSALTAAGAPADARPMVTAPGIVEDFARSTGGGGGGEQMTDMWMMDDGGTTARASVRQQQQQQQSQGTASAGLATVTQTSAACMGLIPRVVGDGTTGAIPAARTTSATILPLTSPVPAPSGSGVSGSMEATARALSHVNYERVFRTVPVPMAIANVNGNLVDCNARLTQVLGFRREEALFMSIFDLVADPFLQHTFSMISSILSLRGVANPPYFQVLGKRRDGSPAGVVHISVVQDDALRPLHFCICVMDGATDGPAGPVGPTPGVFVAARGVGGGGAGGTGGGGGGGGDGIACGGIGGSGITTNITRSTVCSIGAGVSVNGGGGVSVSGGGGGVAKTSRNASGLL